MTPTERAHVWQQHITDWEASGVSGSAYCKQQSLVYHQFFYWRQKALQSRIKRPPGSLGSFLFLALALAELMAWPWYFPVVSPSPVYTPATSSCSALF